MRKKLFQDTNVLQIEPKLAEMSENRQFEPLFCNKRQKPQIKLIETVVSNLGLKVLKLLKLMPNQRV